MLKRYPILLIMLLTSVLAAHAAELHTSTAIITIDDNSGKISSIHRKQDNTMVVTDILTIYNLLSDSQDYIADESCDRAEKLPGEPGELIYQCTNPDLPQLIIRKRYWIENDGLRRELTFINNSDEIRYMMPFTESHFSRIFQRDSYYFGAGYLGPYHPAVFPRRPQRLESWKQSSKGMVLINNDPAKGSYTNYRVKINDTVVYPWWQSTIGTYREIADRLYYLPRGWRMCLGTLDMAPNGGNIRITDAFNFFTGDIFHFFSDVYGKDQEVQQALAAIPPSPAEWTDDLFCTVNYSDENNLRYLDQMVRNGHFIVTSGLFFRWADYRIGDRIRSYYGGEYTREELQTFFRSFAAVTPRAHHFNYAITVAATFDAPILQEHPEWFRRYDRRGNDYQLFPGVIPNFQTMMNNPACRYFMANHIFDMAREFGLDMIYLDEAQQQNTINWQTGELIRDDHNIALWQLMKQRSIREKIPMFFNGSGLPFADVNYMEALDQLRSENWRNFCGVALGLELFSQYRPESRICLIGWSHSKTVTDYANRCIALGWLPTNLYPQPLLTMRAAYEVGRTLPIPVSYTPDWKKDFPVDVESYSVRRRNFNDVILSFINRQASAADIPVTVDLSTCGFADGTRINVWAMHTKHCSQDDPDYLLSENEYAANYSRYNWLDGTISTPELIYSGNASGTLQHTFRDLAKDDMVQLVITASPVALYAGDGVPVNYFFTGNRRSAISRKQLTTSERCSLIFADREQVFTEITANGQKLDIRQADVGGLLCQIVTLEPGEYTLDWQSIPRTAIQTAGTLQAVFRTDPARIEAAGVPEGTLLALELRGRTRLTGTSPLMLPEQYENAVYQLRIAGSDSASIPVTLSGGGTSAIRYQPNPRRPEHRQITDCDVTVNGIHIKRYATWASYSRPIRRLQEELLPSLVIADPQNMRLVSRSTRKEAGEDSNHYAGFEIDGVTSLHLKLTSHFYGQYSPARTGHHVYGAGIPTLDFAGLVVDYRVNGRYTHRVNFSVGIHNARLNNPYPKWGCSRKQDQLIDLGDLINQAPTHEFILDLAQYAPENWDGTVFFSVGCNHILPSRGLTVELLGGSNPGNIPVIQGRNPQAPTRQIPPPMALGKISTPPQPATVFTAQEYLKWPKITNLLPLPSYGETLGMPTTGYCAYDEDNLYFVIVADETSGQALQLAGEPYSNDRVELYFQIRPDQNFIQIIADAGGKTAKFVGRTQDYSLDGIQCFSQYKTGENFKIFLVVPWAQLGFTEIYPGIGFKFNLCRVKISGKRELSCWAPVQRLFNETAFFGTLHLGSFNRTNGRYNEFIIK